MLQALGDLVESCLGAILLDTGFNLNVVWERMLSFLKPVMTFSSFQLSPIRELRELCQAHAWDLKFLSSKKGRTYSIEATVNGNNASATASSTGSNKKDAIRVSAQLIFEKLKVKIVCLMFHMLLFNPYETSFFKCSIRFSWVPCWVKKLG